VNGKKQKESASEQLPEGGERDITPPSGEQTDRNQRGRRNCAVAPIKGQNSENKLVKKETQKQGGKRENEKERRGVPLLSRSQRALGCQALSRPKYWMHHDGGGGGKQNGAVKGRSEKSGEGKVVIRRPQDIRPRNISGGK